MSKISHKFGMYLNFVHDNMTRSKERKMNRIALVTGQIWSLDGGFSSIRPLVKRGLS